MEDDSDDESFNGTGSDDDSESGDSDIDDEELWYLFLISNFDFKLTKINRFETDYLIINLNEKKSSR